MTQPPNEIEARIAEIETRENTASPGPWATQSCYDEDMANYHRWRGEGKSDEDVGWVIPRDSEHAKSRCAGITFINADGEPEEIVTTDSGVYGPDMKDALFIAHARQDIPWLIETLRSSRLEVERLEQLVVQHHVTTDVAEWGTECQICKAALSPKP